MTNMIVTAYCACALCCGEKKPTASGAWPVEGITIAAPRSVPFGTRVFVDFGTTNEFFPGRIHAFTVQDRLSKKYDDRLDIFFTSHEKAKKFGIRKLNVFLEATEPKRTNHRKQNAQRNTIP
mgnify:CR=1 FL=1